MIKLKTNKFKKKHIIKVPKYVEVTYCNNKNILILNGKLGQKVIKSPVKIFLIPDKKLIVVTDIATFVTVRKNFKNLQGTTVGKIKQCLTEICYTLFLKLKLIGVGYRVFPYEKLPNQLYFKLGYSHLIYFQILIVLYYIYYIQSISIYYYKLYLHLKLT
jgi:ribosomal protein L6P/L9E